MITKENIIWSFNIHLYEMNRDQSSGRSRPSDKRVEGGKQASTFWDGGGGDSKNIFFGLKISGGGGGAGPSLGSVTAISLEILYVDLQGA